MTAISVTAPVGQAVEWMRTMLFRPFSAAKWFTIGFCAWLAYLGQGGGGGGFNGNFGGGEHHNWGEFRTFLEHARNYIAENIAWLAPLAVCILMVIVAISLVILWLNSRGDFMFLHCVALDRAEIEVPWRQFGPQANSLFLFRAVVALISMAVFLPLVALLILDVVSMALRQQVTAQGIFIGLALVFAMVVFGTIGWVISRFTKDFIVPIQYLKRVRCLDAWREFRRVAAGNWGEFFLYLLFRIVLGIAIGVLVLALVLVTCCLAGCLLAIPYLGTVLFLPVLVFERAYSLKYLAQFGPAYDVFAVSPVPGNQGA